VSLRIQGRRRAAEMSVKRLRGATLSALADEYVLSVGRVHQICQDTFHKCGVYLPMDVPTACRKIVSYRDPVPEPDTPEWFYRYEADRQ